MTNKKKKKNISNYLLPGSTPSLYHLKVLQYLFINILHYTIITAVYETRCPKGKKTVLYHRAKVEKYAPYLNADGLVEKIVVYVDTARKHTLLLCVEEY